MSQVDYSTVTETPGRDALPETLDALRTRYELAADLAEGKDVLELACGPGMGLGYLARKARKVVGGDFDFGLVKQAQDYYGSRFEIMQMDASDLPFPDDSFDVILLLEAIYYLPEPEKFIAESKRVLRHDGILLICSANCERSDFNPSPFTHRYFSAGELGEMLGNSGFEVELSVAFPVADSGDGGGFLGVLRKIAVKLNLIPKTMGGKELLKKLIYRNLEPFPRELKAEGRLEPLVAVNSGVDVRGFKVVYATGRLSHSQQSY